MSQEPSAAPRRILVVDDEESLRHMLGLILQRAGYQVVTAVDGQDALEVLDRDHEISVVLCDIRMPRLDGLGFLEAARRAWPDLLVIVMSAYGTTDTALEAVKRGAYDFVSKPFRPDEIVLTLRKVEERERLARENERLREEVARERQFGGLVGARGGLRKVAELAAKVAGTSSTVLITGDSGTGKEILARAIHAWSPQAEAPFVAVNCGAIPENLLESELFGHERGAFTGAVRTRLGLFEQASGGSLLLDEIGEVPLALQVKLLRVLEEGRVRRLGAERDVPVRTRILAATARDLPGLVTAGAFREDLYYRLDVVRIHLPPLRDRPEDIPHLVDHFLGRYAARQGVSRPRVSPEVLKILERHPWPGNVRQLVNVCERAALLADGGLITPEHLPPEVITPVRDPLVRAAASRALVPDDEDLSIRMHCARLEKELILRALHRTGGNRSQAARLLSLSYKALAYKIRDYGIDA